MSENATQTDFYTDDGVDRTLIAAHLRMSYEERIAANDHAIQAIIELRDAFKQRNKRHQP